MKHCNMLAMLSLAVLVLSATVAVAGILLQNPWLCLLGIGLLLKSMCIFWDSLVEADKDC
jgi:hypothetical protein